MMELPTDCFELTQEALASFLDDAMALNLLEMDLAADYRLQEPSADPKAAAGPPNATTTSKPTRIRPRDRLQAVRDEVASLQRQLQLLHENHELRESLNQLLNCSSTGEAQQWKRQAVSERIRGQQADERNTLLRERVAANDKLLEMVSSLVYKQTIHSPPAGPRFVVLENDGALILRSLRAALDARYSRLDIAIPPYDNTAAALNTRITPAPWPIRCSDRGVSVDYTESFAMPFSLALILDIMRRFTLVDGHEERTDSYVDKITQVPAPSYMYPRDRRNIATESERRLIHRCIVDSRGITMLWEGLSCWESTQEPGQRVMVRNSGWALVSPLAPHMTEVSAAHYGGFMKIYAADESRLETTDALVTHIARSIQALHRSRNMFMENMLIDRVLQQTRHP